MRPERVESPKPQGSESAVDNLLFVAVGAVFAATVLVWVVGQVAAVLFGAHHWLPVSLAEVAGVPFHLAKHPGDPRLAWPASVRGMLPGPVGMYTALVVVLVGPVGLASGLLGRRWSWDRRLQKQGAQWATRWRLRRLIVLSPRPGRITLGRRGGWWGRLLLAVESCHSVLCFGPAGSFKTAGLVIPAVLEWQGPVITTSIKPDVLRATLRRRLALGEVWVYDPLGLSGVPAAQWTPLAHCGTYTQARKVARTLAEAADVSGLREQDANYWTLLGAKLLGVLLFAAARSDRTMADVARWVDVQDRDQVTEASAPSMAPPRRCWTCSPTRSSPPRPTAATWTSTRSLRVRTRCTCTPRPTSKAGSGRCSSCSSARSSPARRSWPPDRPTGCWSRGCWCVWTRPVTAPPWPSSQSWPPPHGGRGSSSSPSGTTWGSCSIATAAGPPPC
jgi:Type IV secretory system Conjugative DNA transfer